VVFQILIRKEILLKFERSYSQNTQEYTKDLTKELGIQYKQHKQYTESDMSSTLTLTPSSASPQSARSHSVTSPSAVVATPLASLHAELEHHRGLLPPWHRKYPLRRRLYLNGMRPVKFSRPGATRPPGGVSPQYRVPPPSPLPGNSVKLGDGRTITITNIRMVSVDIPSPPPSLFQKFINMFLLIPPQIFQRP